MRIKDGEVDKMKSKTSYRVCLPCVQNIKQAANLMLFTYLLTLFFAVQCALP